MKLLIEIEMDNDAFKPDPSLEVRRILDALVPRINGKMTRPEEINLQDFNGNTCGTMKLVSNVAPTFLGDVAQELHTLANGGLDHAGKKATIGQIKTRVREIRDNIYDHLEATP